MAMCDTPHLLLEVREFIDCRVGSLMLCLEHTIKLNAWNCFLARSTCWYYSGRFFENSVDQTLNEISK